MRLAWWSPWPPQRSGIAGRSAELVPLLAARGLGIDVFVDGTRVRSPLVADEPPSPGAVRVVNANDFVWRQAKQHYDLTVYQVGNSHLHRFIWPYLYRYPGLAVLHDGRVHHARAEALLSAGRSRDYVAEFAWSHPGAGPAGANFGLLRLDGPFYYQWPMLRGIVSASRVVAAHSPGVVRELRAEWPEHAIEHIALGEGRADIDTARAGAAFRTAHAIPADATVFGVFGGLTAEKRVLEILEAFQSTLAWIPDARLLLAGAADPAVGLEEAIKALGIGGATIRLPAAGDDEFDEAIAATDVVLSLRWPTALETSGPWVRSLALARATVIIDLPHQSHLPALDPRTWRRLAPCDDLAAGADERAITVAIDLLDREHSLRVAMRRLGTNAGLRNRIGAAARRWWEREHTVERMLADYERVMARAIEVPAPLPSPGWPPHIAVRPGAFVERVLSRDFGSNDIISRRLGRIIGNDENDGNASWGTIENGGKARERTGTKYHNAAMSDDQHDAVIERLDHEREQAERRYGAALAALDTASHLPESLVSSAAAIDAELGRLNAIWSRTSAEAGAGSPPGFLGRVMAEIGRMMPWRRRALHGAMLATINRQAEVTRALIGATKHFHSHVIWYGQTVAPFAATQRRESGSAKGVEVVHAAVNALATDWREHWDALRAREQRYEARTAALTKAYDELREVASLAQQSTGSLRRTVEALSSPSSSSNQPDASSWAAGSTAAPDPNAFAYVAFEDRYRGSTDEIRRRLQDYLPLFAGATNVLDVGCGRGELLDLLREQGVPARGIDINDEMVARCRERGLTADKADAIAFLNAQPEQSLGGLIAIQVVEHLEPTYLIRFIEAAHRAMKTDAPLVLETINAACWSAFFDSYIRDFTHARPLHPDTMRYLAQASGFRSVEIQFRSPFAEEERLPTVPRPAPGPPGDTPPAGPSMADLIEALNAHAERLNARLFTHRDYAIVARR